MSVSISEVLASAGYDPASDPGDARWLISQQDTWEELLEQAEACIELSDAEQKLADAKDDGDPDEIAFYQRQLELTEEAYKR